MTTTTTKVCLHTNCDTEIAGGRLACRSHWYELPVSLRNEIWRHYRAGNTIAHRAAVVEAVRHWDPRTRGALRCHNCKNDTALIDEATNRPTCITCAKAGLTSPLTTTLTCPTCRHQVGILIAIDDGPDKCPECHGILK